MLFTGHSEHTIDAKLRLAIPAKHRALLDPKLDGTVWYCVPWPGEALRLYPQRRFEVLAEQGEQTLLPDPDWAALEATLFGNAERLEMDAEGRITIPRLHLELAGLATPEVVVVGVRNRLEVRDRARWTAELRDRAARLPELVHRIEARRRPEGRKSE